MAPGNTVPTCGVMPVHQVHAPPVVNRYAKKYQLLLNQSLQCRQSKMVLVVRNHYENEHWLPCRMLVAHDVYPHKHSKIMSTLFIDVG